MRSNAVTPLGGSIHPDDCAASETVWLAMAALFGIGATSLEARLRSVSTALKT
jgi:hypothetical protein